STRNPRTFLESVFKLSDWFDVLEEPTMSPRSFMLKPSLADVRKLAPFPQLGQACKIVFGCEQACQKLREFFVNKDAVAYKPDEGRSRLCRDSVALRTMLALIHLCSQNTDYRCCYRRPTTVLLLGGHILIGNSHSPGYRHIGSLSGIRTGAFY